MHFDSYTNLVSRSVPSVGGGRKIGKSDPPREGEKLFL